MAGRRRLGARLTACLTSWASPWRDPPACVAELMKRAGLRDESPDWQSRPAHELLATTRAQLHRKLKTLPAGERPIPLIGSGLDFARLREYQPGDDARALDWHAYARTRTPHVRERFEEKTLTTWLLLDLTPSMQFGARRRKAYQAVEIAIAVGTLAQAAGYRVGLLAFDGAQSRVVAPGHGLSRFQALARSLQQASAEATQRANAQDAGARRPVDPLTQALREARRLMQKRSRVVILSDFLSSDPLWPAELAELGRVRDVIAALLTDAAEMALPSRLGLLMASDCEAAVLQPIPAQDETFREAYARWAQGFLQSRLERARFCARACGIDSGDDPLDAALRLFREGASTGVAAC